MSERLTDELVANLAMWAADAKPTTREVESLAREVQEWRALVNGAPCQTCGGSGRIINRFGDIVDPCPDCADGRVPGLVERLAEIAQDGQVDDLSASRLAAIIADLRQMVGES